MIVNSGVDILRLEKLAGETILEQNSIKIGFNIEIVRADIFNTAINFEISIEDKNIEGIDFGTMIEVKNFD